jgi:hypothetical protein
MELISRLNILDISSLSPRASYSEAEYLQQYAIVGDDILFEGNKLGPAYLTLCHILGVDISIAKSMVSDETGIRGEFLKKLYSASSEVSPFPLRLLEYSMASKFDVLEFAYQ